MLSKETIRRIVRDYFPWQTYRRDVWSDYQYDSNDNLVYTQMDVYVQNNVSNIERNVDVMHVETEAELLEILRDIRADVDRVDVVEFYPNLKKRKRDKERAERRRREGSTSTATTYSTSSTQPISVYINHGAGAITWSTS